MHKRNIIILSTSFLLIIYFISKTDFLKSKNKANVLIVNNSNKNIYDFNISLYRYPKIYNFNSIPPHKSRKVSFKSFGDTHYIISFKSNDRIVKKEIGYLTNSMDFNDTILIDKNFKIKVISDSYWILFYLEALNIHQN